MVSRRIHRVLTFAKVEARLVMRGWTFRIALILPAALMALLIFSNIFGLNARFSLWMLFGSLPTALPYLTCSVLTIYMTFAAVLISVDSIIREECLDSFEALSARPWSNGEYAAGKILGDFAPLLLIVALIMAASAVIGLTLSGVDVPPVLFLLYPALMWFPAFLAAEGIATLSVRAFRNRAVSMTASLAAVLLLLLAAGRAGGLADITGFRLPLFFSLISGIPGLDGILLQRAAWAAAGLCLLALGTAISKRPPGKKRELAYSCAMTLLLAAAAVAAGSSRLILLGEGPALRAKMREANARSAASAPPAPLSYRLDCSWHGGDLAVEAKVLLENRTGAPMKEYVFSLNPGFHVEKVTSAGEDVPFVRDVHLLRLRPARALEPGEVDSFTVSYGGLADGEAMYSWIPEELRKDHFDPLVFLPWQMEHFFFGKLFGLVRIGRELAPASHGGIVLVPESMWYPVAGIPFDRRVPGSGEPPFARFDLHMLVPSVYEVISSGWSESFENSKDYDFIPEYPLGGLSMVVGRCSPRSIRIDDIIYTAYTTSSTARLLDAFAPAADTLPGSIRDFKGRLLEGSLDLDYPYQRLRLAEVPAGFLPQGYPADRSSFELVYPELVLVGEGGVTLGMGSARVMMDAMWDRGDAERARTGAVFSLAEVLRNLVSGRFCSIEPMYVERSVDFAGAADDPFSLAVRRFMRSRVINEIPYGTSIMDGTGSFETLSMLLESGGLERILKDPSLTGCARACLDAWSSYVVFFLEASLHEVDVRRFLSKAVESARFERFDADGVLTALASSAGIDTVRIPEFEGESDLPGYLCSDPVVCRSSDEDRERWKVDLEVSNPEPADGAVAVYVWTKHPRRLKLGIMREPDDLVLVEGETSLPVSLTVDYEPYKVSIRTLISRNIPNSLDWADFLGNLDVEGDCSSAVAPQPALPAARPKEIVVDNRDSSFSAVDRGSNPLRGLLLSAGGDSARLYSKWQMKRCGARWIEVVDGGFHGEYVHTARCIASGRGDARAVFETDIAEPGRYEVFFYVHDPFRMMRGDADIHRRIEYHILVEHSGGSDEVVLPLERTAEGWNKLGTYNFDRGAASVTLTDESPAGWVVADAVRWSPAR